MPHKRQTFIRFVVGTESDHHQGLVGLINATADLRYEGRLTPDERVRVDKAHGWFNKHLPVPPFRTGLGRDAVAWFKDDAGDAISQMWELVAVLRDKGVPVRLLRSTHPGRVVYEDEFQIVVEQWRRL